MENELKFKAFKEKKTETSIKDEFWKIIVADDDNDIHLITRMVLKNEEFEGKKLKIIGCFSGSETKKVVAENQDAAVLFLDVVMEKEDSGLEVVRYIRTELKNQNIRIILRTGQPGQAPEKNVLREYDINDYKEKTDLSAQKLITSTISALRSYRDIDTVNKKQAGLEKIILNKFEMIEKITVKEYIQKVVKPTINIIIKENQTEELDFFIAKKNEDNYKIIGGAGKYETSSDSLITEDEFRNLTNNSIAKELSQESTPELINHFATSRGNKYYYFINKRTGFTKLENYLLMICLKMIKTDIDNIELIENQNIIMKELAKEMEKSEIALSIRNDFLRNMTHELKTPMIGIVGIADLLSRTADEKNREEFEALKSCSMRLSNLIDKLLSYEKLKNNDYEIINQPFEFNAVISEAMELIEIDKNNKNLLLTVTLDEKLEERVFNGDKIKIVHIIYLLLENAIKFTIKGEIKLKIALIKEFSTLTEVEIEVSDTGIGMSEEISQKIFNPFYQGEYYLTKKYAGVGISLTILKRMVDLLKGTIDLKTKEGEGTTFTIVLPLETT